MDMIIRLLEDSPAVSAWKITDKTTSTCELFYVGHQLETNRATDTAVTEVTVYTDQDDKRGSATFSVYPYMTEQILKEKIETAVYAASFAMNPYFDLPSQESENELSFSDPSNMAEEDFASLIEELAACVFDVDTIPGGSLNATEFFLYRDTVHIRNSNGVNVSRTNSHGAIEIIPSWTENGKEVEVMQMLEFADCNTEEIAAKVREELLLSQARCEAVPLSEVIPDSANASVKVLLQDLEVSEVLKYFANDLEYSTVYNHANKNELGDCVQGSDITGTKLNMKMVPSYAGAMNSRAFDHDGVLLQETDLIHNGIAHARYGSYRFGKYLGEEKPAGRIPIMVVAPGTKSYAQMTAEPYLRCVKFSGIQVDPFSDYFGGEVRLGFYFDGEKEIPVTGFAISGNLGQVKGNMEYSIEEQTTKAFHGPKYLEITGMTAM